MFLSADWVGAHWPLALRRQRSPREERMVTATERVMGCSGLDTERVLASDRDESACWAAAMVAETWSAGAASVLTAADRSIWFIAAVVASTLSERTDIFGEAWGACIKSFLVTPSRDACRHIGIR